MAQSIIMPKFGQSTDEDVTIVKWHKHEGDTVKKGDVLFEVETEKAVLEAQSFYDGVMLKILVKDKESVPVSAVIAYIGEKGEKAPETAVAPARKQDGSSSAGAPAGRDEPRKEAAAASSSKRVEESRPAARREASATPLLIAATNEPSRLLISPRARALAVKCVINPVNIRGTGPNGRILERDVKTYLAENNYEKLKISPAAGKLASENKIDILTVKGMGRRPDNGSGHRKGDCGKTEGHE